MADRRSRPIADRRFRRPSLTSSEFSGSGWIGGIGGAGTLVVLALLGVFVPFVVLSTIRAAIALCLKFVGPDESMMH